MCNEGIQLWICFCLVRDLKKKLPSKKTRTQPTKQKLRPLTLTFFRSAKNHKQCICIQCSMMGMCSKRWSLTAENKCLLLDSQSHFCYCFSCFAPCECKLVTFFSGVGFFHTFHGCILLMRWWLTVTLSLKISFFLSQLCNGGHSCDCDHLTCLLFNPFDSEGQLIRRSWP